MFRKLSTVGGSLLLAASLLLSSCGTPTVTQGENTLDANAVYTQAAQTVQAGVDMTRAAQPVSDATQTPAPTGTMDPTVVSALTSVAGFTATAQANALTTVVSIPTATGGAAGQTGPTQTPVVQLTPVTQATSAGGAPPTSSGDKAEWISQSPADNTQIKKNASWDMRIVVKNTGTKTWNNKYALKFFSGDRMDSPNDLYVVGEVKPGEMYTFLFTMKAPDSTGKKTTNWVIQNGDGVNFYTVFLTVEVID